MAQLTIQQALQLALQHHQAGQLPQAEHLYRQILAQQPKHVDALHFLGVIAGQVGRNDIALDLIRQAIALKPNWPDFHNSLGNTLRHMDRLDDAIAAFRRALALKPDYPEALGNLGSALKNKGLLDEAIATFRQVLALKPDLAESHSNLGTALASNGQHDEAIAAFRHALALRPNSPDVLSNLGNALKDAGRLDEALAACRQAIALKPNFPEALSNLGIVLANKGQHDDAIAIFRQAIALKPDFPEPHSNLGIVLTTKGQLDEAIAACQQAIALRPNHPEAHNSLGNVLRDQGCIDDAIAAYRRALILKPQFLEAHSNFLYAMHFHPGFDAQAIAREHRIWNRQYAEPGRKLIRPHANTRDPERALRIGYVSPDFREHPVGRFLLPLLLHQDKARFEVFGYAQVPVPDELTQRLRSCMHGWRSIVGLSDTQAADLIRHDQIDILVDLTMHMAHSRLLVFAQKPAPVQVTYLAYCASTGLETIDYRLSDPYLDPVGLDDSAYSEQTIRLPETYWCYEPSINTPEIGPLPALTQGAVTFGCLNNFCKVSEPTLASWAGLLRAVPNSRLLLHSNHGFHRQRLQKRLEREGVVPERVRFEGHLPAEAYFDLYRQIDIALDTFPYGGGTTTCDALWMGVPVVSLKGKTAVGRGGFSILSNIGLPDLVASSEADYVQVACALARNLPRLGELRSTLRQRMRRSPLMDAPRFARAVEAAYRQMWRRWCATSPANT